MRDALFRAFRQMCHEEREHSLAITPWPEGEELPEEPRCSAAAVTKIKSPSDVQPPVKLAPSGPAQYKVS